MKDFDLSNKEDRKFILSEFRDQELIDELKHRHYDTHKLDDDYQTPISDFDDDVVIDSLDERGYDSTLLDDGVFDEIIWRFQYGDMESVAVLLERRFPELHGITIIKRK